jgi:hypothetical protein
MNATKSDHVGPILNILIIDVQSTYEMREMRQC